MTATVEFTYLYDNFSLKLDESIMTRAVRVKTTVKDKIQRVFNSKESVNNNGVEEQKTSDGLINLNEETLLGLNDILNGLQKQQNVTSYSNRAVLFTQPLVAKIFRVTDKWFAGMPRFEKEVVTSTDIPSVDMVNHLGGEVIPGNWNNVEEKENTLSVEPTLEPVPTIPTDLPHEEMVTPNIEIPTSLGNTDVYRFDFNMEHTLPTVEPVFENKEENNTSFDFVPEPKQISNTNENVLPVIEQNVPSFENNDFGFNLPNVDAVVPEVTPSVEMSVSEEIEPVKQDVVLERVPTSEMEDKINNLLNTEFIPNPANNFVAEHVDNRPVEEKIDNLLGRTNMVQETTPEVTPVTLDEPVVNHVEYDKPEITQGQVLARLRRVNNAMAEKDATIKNLTSKNDVLKEEVAVSRDKISEYEVKVSDLSAKNSDLSSQNERLNAKLEESETNSKSTIARLEAKVNELTQSKTDELESLRRQIEELKEKHASEISSMKEKHATELRLVNESKDKQIQAIYSTITEALGDDDYSKGMAA